MRAISVANLGFFLVSKTGGDFKARPGLTQEQEQRYARAGNYNAGALFKAADLPFLPLVFAGGYLELKGARESGDYSNIGPAASFFEDWLDIADGQLGFDCY